jgi:hypothetical protein
MIDSTKTLEQLDGEVWPAPEWQSGLVLRCHELRKKPINEFSVEDLRIVIGQNIGLVFLIPQAIGILKEDPFVEGDCYPGDLLSVVVQADKTFFVDHISIANEVLVIATSALQKFESGIATNDELKAVIEYFVQRLSMKNNGEICS